MVKLFRQPLCVVSLVVRWLVNASVSPSATLVACDRCNGTGAVVALNICAQANMTLLSMVHFATECRAVVLYTQLPQRCETPILAAKLKHHLVAVAI